jgi:hypothetical protein
MNTSKTLLAVGLAGSKRTLLALALLALSASASASLTCNNDDFGQHATWFVGQNPDVLDVVSTNRAVWCVATG